MAYTSIIDWITGVYSQHGWADPIQANPYYPFGDAYNLPYDIGMKLWNIIGGAIAWLLDLLFPGNDVSTWLVCDMTNNIFALVLFMVLVFAVVFVACLISLWEERKVLGRGMDRRGTMIGMWGFLQCVADGLKTFMKDNVFSKKVDGMTYWWTVALIIGTSVLIDCMVPLSPRWFVVNYDAGLLIIMGLYALAPFFILVSGWSQNNKYSLIGGIRAAEMMISYEVPLLIIIATAALLAGSLNINDIVMAQTKHFWYVIPMFVGFVTFMICATAESERAPFDLAEAESELVEGWQTEYGGMKWGLIMLADYLRGACSCGIIVLLFFGGWNLPFMEWTYFLGDGIASFHQTFMWWFPAPELTFLLKAWLVFFVMIAIRLGTGRVRTDTILNLGWKVFMPLSILNLVIVLIFKLFIGGVF
ncbi:MAG: NADH-quinone oxidoreductase subunit H [Candidatus Methanomethylophilus sp.]|nr:NADH-quinone oxidoreductase subunit H [Methanomethylophilus sp.]MEE3477541.1 complex I subunit 1 family protein [Methanomethylophilus sp.]